MDNMRNMWDFPVMDGVAFQNANRVHPLQQRRVQKLIGEFGKDKNIRRLVSTEQCSVPSAAGSCAADF